MPDHDLSMMSDADLKLLVSEWCSEFGAVDEVQILHFERPEPADFALVNMASPEDAMDVVDALGGVDYGRMVIVPLQPVSVRRVALMYSH